jgi:antitoxin MazE
MPAFRTQIIRIGNSQGIRIPKAILEQCHLGKAVMLEPEDDRLVVRPVKAPRAEWDEAFRRMAEQGDDALLDETTKSETEWDDEEWEW